MYHHYIAYGSFDNHLTAMYFESNVSILFRVLFKSESLYSFSETDNCFKTFIFSLMYNHLIANKITNKRIRCNLSDWRYSYMWDSRDWLKNILFNKTISCSI